MKKVNKILSVVIAIVLLVSTLVPSFVYAKTNVASTQITAFSDKKATSVKVKWKKVKSVSGYQIMYSANDNFKENKTVSAKSNQTSKTVSKLKSNRKYYFKVRAYKKNNKKTIYSKWSAVKSTKTTDSNIKEQLLKYYWKNNIQSPKYYEFKEDNTFIEYDALPDEAKSSWSYYCQGKYSIENNKLNLFFETKYGNYTYNLKYVTFKDNDKWDTGLHLNEHLKKNEKFFYESDFKPSTDGPTGNAFYLQKGFKK